MGARRDRIKWKIEETWFGLQPYTLQDFYWNSKNLEAKGIIIDYLKDWGSWKLLNNQWLDSRSRGVYMQKPELPAPFLFLSGAMGVGKTEVLARGLGRFMALNMQFWPVEYVHWPTYIQQSFDDNAPDVDFDADFLVLDDVDGWKPQQKTGSTYILQMIMNQIKMRNMPTLVVTNRKLDQMEKFMSHDINGIVNPEAMAFAVIVLDNLTRKAHDDRQANIFGDSSNSNTKRNAATRAKAIAESAKDTSFLFPEESGWVPAIWW